MFLNECNKKLTCDVCGNDIDQGKTFSEIPATDEVICKFCLTRNDKYSMPARITDRGVAFDIMWGENYNKVLTLYRDGCDASMMIDGAPVDLKRVFEASRYKDFLRFVVEEFLGQ